MRKRRRKIQRRKRKKGKSKRKNWFFRWMDKPISNRFTRLSTWVMLIVETLFLMVCAYWAFIEVTARLFDWWGGI